MSSFNGGDIQFFTVIALNSQQQQSTSDIISDNGENEIHSTYVQNLQPSTTYVFYVSAQNRHGLSSSENITCTTKEGKHSISCYPIMYLILKIICGLFILPPLNGQEDFTVRRWLLYLCWNICICCMYKGIIISRSLIQFLYER